MNISSVEEKTKMESSQGLVRAIWRWHFYAGLICIPFIIILSITGSLYLFKPQIEGAIDRPYDQLRLSGPSHSINDQVVAVLGRYKGAKLDSVEVRPNRNDATRIVLKVNGDKLRVYVHPETLAIMKSVYEEQRFMAQVKTIHGELLAGKFGEIIVELAASWAIVMIMTGLYLWWPRHPTGLGGLIYPRAGPSKRIFWRDLHAVTGLYVSFFALFLLFSGLPWTSVWGDAFKQVRVLTHTQAVKQDWSTRSRAEIRERDDHADHAEQNFIKGAHGSASKTISSDVAHGSLDKMYATVRKLDLPAPVTIHAPTKKQNSWTAQSNTQNRPLRVTLTLDSKTGEVQKTESFDQKHPIDKVIGYVIAAHEGHLFGWVNQALGVFTAISLIALCITSVVMWLKRRPHGKLGAPEPIANTRIGKGLIVIIVALGVFLPVLGMSLLAIAALEFTILRHLPSVRIWLGLNNK